MDDLSWESQVVFSLFNKLPSRWEGFSGQYMGKDLQLLPILFKEFNIRNYIRKYMWDIIPIIDGYVAQDMAAKINSKSKRSTT